MMADEHRHLLWAQKLVACFRKDGSLSEYRLLRVLFSRKERAKDVCVDLMDYSTQEEEWNYYIDALIGKDMFNAGWEYVNTRSCYAHANAVVRFIIKKHKEKQRGKKKRLHA